MVEIQHTHMFKHEKNTALSLNFINVENEYGEKTIKIFNWKLSMKKMFNGFTASNFFFLFRLWNSIRECSNIVSTVEKYLFFCWQTCEIAYRVRSLFILHLMKTTHLPMKIYFQSKKIEKNLNMTFPQQNYLFTWTSANFIMDKDILFKNNHIHCAWKHICFHLVENIMKS